MKKLLFSLSIFICSLSFGQVFINSNGGLQPSGNYAGYYGNYLQGGTKIYANQTARNNDSVRSYLRDTSTFLCYTIADSSMWRLSGGVLNSNFVKVSLFNTTGNATYAKDTTAFHIGGDRTNKYTLFGTKDNHSIHIMTNNIPQWFYDTSGNFGYGDKLNTSPWYFDQSGDEYLSQALSAGAVYPATFSGIPNDTTRYTAQNLWAVHGNSPYFQKGGGAYFTRVLIGTDSGLLYVTPYTISNLLPYTGATSNTNTGIYNITSNAIISAKGLLDTTAANGVVSPTQLNAYAQLSNTQTFTGANTFTKYVHPLGVIDSVLGVGGATSVTLTASSPQTVVVQNGGSAAAIITLPVNTTCSNGQSFIIYNATAFADTIKSSGGSVLYTLPTMGGVICFLPTTTSNFYAYSISGINIGYGLTGSGSVAAPTKVDSTVVMPRIDSIAGGYYPYSTNPKNYTTLQAISATTPATFNSSTGVIGIGQATTSTNGYLSSGDWNTFNGKQSTITLTTTGTSGAATFTSNTLNIPQYANSSLTTNTQTSSYTLAIGDAGALVLMNVVSANTLTVPPNSSVAFPVGTQIYLTQIGTEITTITAGAGVTINSEYGALKLNTQYSSASLIKTATNTWLLVGSLSQ